MRKNSYTEIFLQLFIITSLVTLPQFALAHGGAEKTVGNTVVYYTQSPLSPLVGEEVEMTFIFANRANNLERLEGLDVELSLFDTVHGDPSKDKLILTRNYTTDANGATVFNYTFDKANYFDVELKFNDPVTQEEQTTGFLVETRELGNLSSNEPRSYGQILVGAVLGLLIGLGIGKLRRRQKA